MNIQLLIYKSSANKVLESYQAIKDKIDVLWMLPDPSVINDNNFLYLAEKTIEDKLPFIVYSENFVKAGGLFSISPNYSTVGSQLAIMVQKVLEDSLSPKDIPISPIIGTYLTVNRTVLRKVGLKINEALIDKSIESN